MPAIGVIVGWLLSELSQLFKSRRENRRLINKSLYSLLDLLFILNQKKSLLGSAIKADKLTGMQCDIVGMLFEDNRFSSDEFKSKIFQTINDLAEVDPILCQGLRIQAEAVLMFDRMRSYESNVTLNKKGIESEYKVLKVFTRQMEILVKKVVNKHSLLMRVRYEIYKRHNLSEGKAAWNILFQDME